MENKKEEERDPAEVAAEEWVNSQWELKEEPITYHMPWTTEEFELFTDKLCPHCYHNPIASWLKAIQWCRDNEVREDLERQIDRQIGEAAYLKCVGYIVMRYQTYSQDLAKAEKAAFEAGRETDRCLLTTLVQPRYFDFDDYLKAKGK